MPSSSRTSERPTLPPLHTLDLPFMPPKSSRSVLLPRSRYTHELRKASTSSSTTSASPPSSRSPSPASSRSSSTSSMTTPSGQVRLVRCPLEDANALILVPAPDGTPFTAPFLKHAQPGQSLLLVGQTMQQFVRHPQRELSKGARMHPYKAVPVNGSGSLSRRSSVASMISLPQ